MNLSRIYDLRDHLMNEGILILYTIILLFITPVDYILYIKWIDSMQNYNWYASSLIFPLFGIIFFSLGTYYYYIKGRINQENKISQKYLLSIGIMDGMSSQLSSFATPYLSIIVITILDKLSLPLILLGSIVMLNNKYYKNHYLGVFLTVYAIMVSFLPKFSNGVNNTWWAVIVFNISLLPSVMSFILKEKYINDEINIWWMNLYISIWQFLFGICMLPLMFIPVGKEGINYIPIKTIDDYFRDASRCQFFGIDSKDNDNCSGSFIMMILYQIMSTFINILMFYIIRDGSSTYFVLINSLKLPIQAWLASYKSISGQNYAPVSLNDMFSFILLVVATLVYNDKKEIKKDNNQSTLNMTNYKEFIDRENENEKENEAEHEFLTL